jgi:hypothetical protein
MSVRMSRGLPGLLGVGPTNPLSATPEVEAVPLDLGHVRQGRSKAVCTSSAYTIEVNPGSRHPHRHRLGDTTGSRIVMGHAQPHEISRVDTARSMATQVTA